MPLGMLLVVFALSLSLPSMSWAQGTVMHEKWGSREAQYSEEADRVDETIKRTYERDWYEDAYEDYEESPYGYYEEDSFYGDFDLNYWNRDSDGNWYEKKFYQYGRGYLESER